LHEPELLGKWRKALQIDNWTPTKHFYVCSEHFVEDDYEKSPTGVKLTYLSCNAVPSIFNNSSKPKLKTYSVNNK